MGAGEVIIVTCVAALSGFLFQPTRDFLTTSLGLWREVQPVSDFPFSCHKIEHPQLHACEDLWIDEKARELYLACSDPIGRKHWTPSVTRLNNTGRTKTDHFSVLSLDDAGADGLWNLRTLKTSGYTGTNGDKTIDLHGFDVEEIGGNKLRFWVVNHRPPLDPATGEELDGTKVGANSTVEVFELARGGDTLKLVETYADPLIATPNRVTATGDDGFVMTNDKSVKVGFRRSVDILAGGGYLVHCQHSFCQRASPDVLKYPNGLTRSHKDGLYYVPSSVDAHIYVYALMPQGTLALVDKIRVGQPMDNLAVDAKGDIYAAAFPKVLQLEPAFEDPLGTKAATAVWRVRKREEGEEGEGLYKVEKVLEDRDSEVSSFTTGVVHDVKTGRLWLGGVHSPYITVCDPK